MTDVSTNQKPAQSLQDVRKKGEEAIDHAKDAATDLLETGKARAEEELVHGKNTIARSVQDFADAAKAAAKDLRDHDQTFMASWADAAADGMSNAAHGIEGRNIHEIFGQIEDYARRQPAVFLAGVALAGFAAARFAKAARENSARTMPPTTPRPTPATAPTPSPVATNYTR